MTSQGYQFNEIMNILGKIKYEKLNSNQKEQLQKAILHAAWKSGVFLKLGDRLGEAQSQELDKIEKEREESKHVRFNGFDEERAKGESRGMLTILTAFNDFLDKEVLNN